jgi:hypothetical protein
MASVPFMFNDACDNGPGGVRMMPAVPSMIAPWSPLAPFENHVATDTAPSAFRFARSTGVLDHALDWSQHVNYHEQRGPHRLRKESLLFGIDVVRGEDDLV